MYSSFVHGGSIETAQAGCVMQEDDFQKVQFGCLSFDSELAPPLRRVDLVTEYFNVFQRVSAVLFLPSISAFCSNFENILFCFAAAINGYSGWWIE